MAKKEINKTSSICNTCLKRVNAEVIERNNKIFIKKKCKTHGTFTSPHVWDDPETYKFLMHFEKFKFPSRKILLNITNQCNLNCNFCYAKANEINIKELKLNDIKKINLSSFEYVFLSGGEPTIKEDLFEIIKYLKKNKKRVVLFTNGLKLKDNSYVKALKETGLDLVFLQFDSLDKKDIINLRGIPLLEAKFKVIKNLNKENQPVFFFSIMLKKDNLRTINSLVDYFKKNKKILRGINFNPIWKIGRFNDKKWISTAEITKNACKVLHVEKKDFLLSTEFVYYFFMVLSSLKDKRRYFSRCILFLLAVYNNDKVIPITKIFNVEKMTKYFKEITIKDKKTKYFNLLIYLLFSQFFINFFINRNFRLFMWESIKRLRFVFAKNMILLNPFTTFNISEFPTAEDLDFNFVDTCNMFFYSPENKSLLPVCINQIKFARSAHPLYDQR